MTPKPNDKREVRDRIDALELRAAAEGAKGPGTIVGYAAMFNTLSLDLGYFREQIAPGAFAKAIGRCDVRALFNHDPACILGRTSAGTLRLVEDEVGLRMECELPDTQLGRDVAESIRRRDIQGQSFAFTCDGEQWDWKAEPPLRTVLEAGELFDVGPVTYPAYEETSVALRSFQHQQAKEQAPAPPSPLIAIAFERDAARLRLLEVL
jgi:HK97 family phage prohead protease